MADPLFKRGMEVSLHNPTIRRTILGVLKSKNKYRVRTHDGHETTVEIKATDAMYKKLGYSTTYKGNVVNVPGTEGE